MHNILSGQDIAIKLEPVEGRTQILEHKFYVYQKLGGRISIPCAHWFGVESGFNVMAMSHLGQSLEDLFVQHKSLFSNNAVL